MADWGIETSGIGVVADSIDEAAESLENTTYIVGTNVKYAVYLEFGTSKMQPYPFLGPARDKVMTERADSIVDSADTPAEAVRDIASAIEAEAKHFASDGVPPGPDEQTSNLKKSIIARKL